MPSRSCSSPTTSTAPRRAVRIRQPRGGRRPADDEVEAIAARLASFDHEAIARVKSYVDLTTLPSNTELAPPVNDFRELFGRPAQQAQWARLQQLGLNTDSDLERSLGQRLVDSLPDQYP